MYIVFEKCPPRISVTDRVVVVVRFGLFDYYLVFLYSTRIVSCQADEELLSFEVFRALNKSVQYYRVSSVKGSYWSEFVNKIHKTRPT